MTFPDGHPERSNGYQNRCAEWYEDVREWACKMGLTVEQALRVLDAGLPPLHWAEFDWFLRDIASHGPPPLPPALFGPTVRIRDRK